MSMAFNGFPAEGRNFLADLSKNNNRDWFQKNKKNYQTFVKIPAELLKDTLCNALSEELGRDVQGKIFRINRDLRFSKDKTPYNCHVRMMFWPAEGGGDANVLGAAFMLSIEAKDLICGVGKMGFEKAQLTLYRDRISEPDDARELQSLLDNLSASGARISDYDLVRPPAGTDNDHPFPDLLRYKGLCAWRDLKVPKGLASSGADKVLLSEFKTLWPLYDWLNRPA